MTGMLYQNVVYFLCGSIGEYYWQSTENDDYFGYFASRSDAIRWAASKRATVCV